MIPNNGKVAFVGGGNMTRAIAGGLVDSGFEPANLFLSEPLADARESLLEALPGVNVSADNTIVAAEASSVFLAVKPQVLHEVCRGLRETVQKTRPLMISIAAGTRGKDINNWLGGGMSIVRAMPNQPALLGLGITGVFANEQTSSDEKARAIRLLGAVGKVVEVNSEAAMDAVTAVSGTGPAYFYLFIDILVKTAVELGLREEDAKTLAVETAFGAAALAESEPANMDALITRVSSPGGTTIAAMDVLNKANVRDIFSAAITAARDRAYELSDEAEKLGTTA
jgi:pyrroline-5-carboxylate reductase